MISIPASKYPHAPIVEAVLDIDCDLPPGFNLVSVEAPFKARLATDYPKFQAQRIHEIVFDTDGLKPVQAGGAIQALQFRDKEEKQLIQVRTQGFSFNRLAPYSTLDEYLPEIERLWNLYTELAAPVKTRAVKLRYINRIILPMNGSLIELDEYLKTGPRVPGEEGMTLTNFLIQHSAVENATNLNVSWVLTSQVPADGKLPIILDITVGTPPLAGDPNDWATIRSSIDGLRILKNRVFENILSPKCLELFQ